MKFKIVLLGDPSVGKTSLVSRFVLNNFDEKYITTLGTRVYKKEVPLELDGEKRKVILMVWDTLGQKGFERILQNALRGSKGAIMVSDITRRETFDNLEKWVFRTLLYSGAMPMVFVANKSDLKDKYDFSAQDMRDLGDKYDFPAYLTSAKTGNHVEEAFKHLAREITHVLKGKKELPPISNLFCAKLEQEKGKEIDIDSLFHLEDYVISTFCERFGNQQDAMPIIRQQFKTLHIDFTSPSLNDMMKVSQRLIDIMGEMKGDGEAKGFKREIQRAITRYNKSKSGTEKP